MVNRKTLFTHRLSWELHKEPIPDGLCVCHTCDNRICINPDHLFLGTDADNMADRDKKGRQARGSKNGRAKYTDEQVIEFKKAVANRGTKTIKEVGEEFGIPDRTARNIASGHFWKHL